jgi:hypothetical protein
MTDSDLHDKKDEYRFFRNTSLQCAFFAAATLALTLTLPRITGNMRDSFVRADPAYASSYRMDTEVRTPCLQLLSAVATAIYAAGAVRHGKLAREVRNEIKKEESLRPFL